MLQNICNSSWQSPSSWRDGSRRSPPSATKTTLHRLETPSTMLGRCWATARRRSANRKLHSTDKLAAVCDQHCWPERECGMWPLWFWNRESVITYCRFILLQPVKKIGEWRLTRGMGGDTSFGHGSSYIFFGGGDVRLPSLINRKFGLKFSFSG